MMFVVGCWCLKMVVFMVFFEVCGCVLVCVLVVEVFVEVGVEYVFGVCDIGDGVDVGCDEIE